MNSEKYYTPSLEEFKKGFIFEYKMNNGGWTEVEIKMEEFGGGMIIDFRGELMSLLDLLFIVFNRKCTEDTSDVFRVKFLNRRDIESFGFVTDDDGETYVLAEGLDIFSLYPWEFDRGVKNQYKIIKGIKEDLFFGIIKNKSELKNILKQINVL